MGDTTWRTQPTKRWQPLYNFLDVYIQPSEKINIQPSEWNFTSTGCIKISRNGIIIPHYISLKHGTSNDSLLQLEEAILVRYIHPSRQCRWIVLFLSEGYPPAKNETDHQLTGTVDAWYPRKYITGWNTARCLKYLWPRWPINASLPHTVFENPWSTPLHLFYHFSRILGFCWVFVTFSSFFGRKCCKTQDTQEIHGKSEENDEKWIEMMKKGQWLIKIRKPTDIKIWKIHEK